MNIGNNSGAKYLSPNADFRFVLYATCAMAWCRTTKSTKQHNCFADCFTESYERETFYLIIHGQNSYGPHKKVLYILLMVWMIHVTRGTWYYSFVYNLRRSRITTWAAFYMAMKLIERNPCSLHIYQIYFNFVITNVVSIFVSFIRIGNFSFGR